MEDVCQVKVSAQRESQVQMESNAYRRVGRTVGCALIGLAASLALLCVYNSTPLYHAGNVGISSEGEKMAALKLHVLPMSELLSQPFDDQDQAPSLLKPSLAQFAVLFPKHAAIAYMAKVEITHPTDVIATRTADATSAANTLSTAALVSQQPPSPPVHSPPLSPSSPSLRAPPPVRMSPPPAAPWWIVESRLPPRPKRLSNTTATLLLGAHSKRWAFEVLDPTPGTLLFSRGAPPSCMPYLTEEAVVLLVKTCGCHPSVFGILLSAAPSRATVGEAMSSTIAARAPAFVNHSVHVGGPAGPHWTMLHAVEPDSERLGGAVDLQPGLRAGGCPIGAQRLVDQGAALSSQFAFYSGYAAWPLVRLRAEVAQGRWGLARASPSLILGAITQHGRLDARTLREEIARHDPDGREVGRRAK